MPPPPRLATSAQHLRASVFADLAPRIEAFEKRGGELIALHIGDTHRAPPAAARFDGKDREDPSLYRYGGIAGLPSLKEACVASLVARGRAPAGLDPRRHVLLGCGATHALFCAARAVLDPGDEVLLAAPYWPLTVGVLRAAGATPVEVPLTDRLYADPSLDPAALFEAAITPRTRAMYVTSPNNPDGKVLSRRQLESLARVADEWNLWVFSDEVYADYAYSAPHTAFATLEGMAERTIAAYSFSKSHALAGARVGFVIGPEEVIATALRVSTHTVFNVPVVAQRIAVAALEQGAAWIDEAREEYQAALQEAVASLEGTPVRFHRADGGCYLFLDFRPLLGDRPLKPLLERAIDRGVLLAPGDAFGAGYERWARLCFTSVPRPKLREGIERLKEAMASFA